MRSGIILSCFLFICVLCLFFSRWTWRIFGECFLGRLHFLSIFMVFLREVLTNILAENFLMFCLCSEVGCWASGCRFIRWGCLDIFMSGVSKDFQELKLRYLCSDLYRRLSFIFRKVLWKSLRESEECHWSLSFPLSVRGSFLWWGWDRKLLHF